MPHAHSAGSTPPVVVIAPDSFKGSLSAEQVAEAISNGIRRALLDLDGREFDVALGGSSTNDGGAGLLAGLGVKLFDGDGKTLDPVPSQPGRIARIDATGLDPRVREAEFTGMSDVDNPLTGEHGATAIFGPQKGVTADQIATIDAALAHFADLLEPALQLTAHDKPGA